MYKGLYTFIILFIAHIAFCQSAHKNLMNGDEQYLEESFGIAELEYRKADNENSSFKSSYNLANSLYKQGRFEEAGEQFNRALSKTGEDLERAMTYHNMGNSYLMQKKPEEAINFYKLGIKANPNNLETKYNLVVAKEMLRNAKMEEQQQQQQQQQENQENQENQDQQSQQDSTQQQQQQEEQNQDGENNESQDSLQQENPQDSLSQEDIQAGEMDSTRMDKSELDSLDAIKLLQIIENEEQKVQERLKKFNSKRKKSDKEW